MDAIVLAGGYATRLWPITIQKSKMLLPLDGESLVFDNILPELEAADRIDNVYINTNRGHRRMFRQCLLNRSYTKPTLSVEDTREESEKYGVVGGLNRLIRRENITDDILVIGGDNIINFSVAEALEFYDDVNAPVLGAYDVGSYEAAKQYGVLSTDDTRVVDFHEKPDDPDTTLASIAFYVFPSEQLDMIDTYLGEGNNSDEPGWFIQWLYQQTAVHAFSFEEQWFDIGTPESYREAVQWALGDDAHVADSATVNNATVSGGTVLMDGATVENATVEDSVIFENATVTSSTVEDCLIGNDAEVHGLDCSQSSVGPHTNINNDR